MTTEHEQHDEELLAQVAMGERGEDEPEVRALLESCAHCREELDSLRAATELLEDAGAQERRVFAEARAMSRAPGEARVAPLVHQLSRGPGPRPLLLPIAGVALAAAAILVFFLVDPLGDGGSSTLDDNGPVILGPSDELSCDLPIGEVSDFTIFRWSGDAAPGHDFVVRVWSAEASAIARPLLESPHVQGNEWAPSADELAGLPSEIRWDVRLFDEADRRVSQARGEASLR